MKRLLCLLFACLLTFACAKKPADDAAPSEAPNDTDPVDTVDPDQLPDFPVPEIEGYEGFANVFSAKLVDGTQNRNLSPISVYLALAMTAEGTAGETLTELLSLLGVKDLAELRGVCGAMLQKLSIDEKDSALVFANSIWLDDHNGQLKFHDAYLATLSETYRSEAHAVNLKEQSVREQIADWIGEHTRGKIRPDPNSFPFDPETIAVLINTIYLKDMWEHQFSESATEPDTFHAPDGDMTVDYMRRVFGESSIVQGEGYLRYSIPLRNVGRMTFVLPDEGVALTDLLGTPEKLSALLKEGERINADVHVKLPKFAFRDKLDLNEVLKTLGAELAFSDDADFSAMCNIGAKISRVLQESYIGVDENGVEAAAYTMVIVNGKSAMPQEELPQIDFHLERPFLYVIESYDGTVYFIGTVTNPTV